VSVTEVGAYKAHGWGRLSCGWLRVVCTRQHRLWWEVGVAGLVVLARQADLSGRLGATGGARRLRHIDWGRSSNYKISNA